MIDVIDLLLGGVTQYGMSGGVDWIIDET